MLSAGTRVKLSAEAIENYGPKYRHMTFMIESGANKYMSASEFFAKGQPAGFHPGYDEGAGGVLYSLVDMRGKALPFDVYSWEIVPQ